MPPFASEFDSTPMRSRERASPDTRWNRSGSPRMQRNFLPSRSSTLISGSSPAYQRAPSGPDDYAEYRRTPPPGRSPDDYAEYWRTPPPGLSPDDSAGYAEYQHPPPPGRSPDDSVGYAGYQRTPPGRSPDDSAGYAEYQRFPPPGRSPDDSAGYAGYQRTPPGRSPDDSAGYAEYQRPPPPGRSPGDSAGYAEYQRPPPPGRSPGDSAGYAEYQRPPPPGRSPDYPAEYRRTPPPGRSPDDSAGYAGYQRTPPPGRSDYPIGYRRTPPLGRSLPYSTGYQDPPPVPASAYSVESGGPREHVISKPLISGSADSSDPMTSYRLGEQTPSSGLWSHIEDAEQVEMPLDVQIIFGLCCQKSATASQSKGAYPAVMRSQPCHGATSLEGVWKLAYRVHQRKDTPLEAFKQFKHGEISIIRSLSASPLQRQFKGTGAISDEEADRPCRELSVEDMLGTLNSYLGTSYQIDGDDDDDSLRALLSTFIEDQSMDFGTAYGHLRRGWFCDVSRLQSRLSRAQRQHEDLRRNAIKDDLIVNPHIPPRRVWDLYSNRVLPFWVLLSSDIPRNLWAVSHSWVRDEERSYVWTKINGCEWPVPIPDDVELEQVRVELLNLGAEYVWLDVLCLRQNMRGPGGPLTQANMKLEKVRLEEWRLDVPTIGYVYRYKPDQVVVTYFNGLGRPFGVSDDDYDDDRHWLNRVWTMQETSPNWFIGGLQITASYQDSAVRAFHSQMCDLLSVLSNDQPDLFALMTFLRRRNGSQPSDSISALAYLLKCPCIPIYDQEQKPEDAWELLVQQLDPRILTDLLFLSVDVGSGDSYWRPSWHQLMESADVSLPLSSSSIDYSHRDLLRYTPGSAGMPCGPVYSNYAYLIEKVSFVEKGEEVFVRVHIAQRQGGQTDDPLFPVSYVGHCCAGREYAAVAVADLEHWVLGCIDRNSKHFTQFQKVSVFGIGDRKVREKIWHLNPGFADTKIYYI